MSAGEAAALPREASSASGIRRRVVGRWGKEPVSAFKAAVALIGRFLFRVGWHLLALHTKCPDYDFIIPDFEKPAP